MEFPKLSEEQRDIARMIADAARSHGIDPELALAVGWTENHFKPSGVSSAGALGPMQVMPANAEGLGLNPKDLLNPQINIDAGMRILKQNLQAHGGNPVYALVGYNASPTTAKSFAKHNDVNRLPEETRNYLQRVGSMHDISQPGFLPEEASREPQESDLSYLGALPADIDQVPPQPSTFEQRYQQARDVMSGPTGEIDKPLMTGAGALTGAAVGASQAGIGFGKKVNRVLDALQNASGTGPITDMSQTPGQKWKNKTGYGRGNSPTVEGVDLSYKRGKGQGKLTERMSGLFGVPEQGESTLDMMLRKKKAEEQIAKQIARAKMLDRINVVSKIPIIGPVIAGGATGYDIADAIDRYEKGDTSGAVLQGLGALGSAAALVPHPLTKAIGTGVSLGSIPAVMLNDYLKKQE